MLISPIVVEKVIIEVLNWKAGHCKVVRIINTIESHNKCVSYVEAMIIIAQSHAFR